MDGTLASVRVMHTYEELSGVLDYNAETGQLTWKISKGRAKAGHSAGSQHNKGYLTLEFEGVAYLAHRVAWLLYHKKWPEVFIDHEDLDKSNNRIKNLRLATRAGNCQNHPARADNTSGVKGVNWHQGQQQWTARVQANGKRHSLGYFDSVADAEAAIIAARPLLHKEYSNNGNSSSLGLRH